jgi:hypothetical protein
MNENIIHLFGTYLSGILHKSPLACKGLVRLAIIRYLQMHQFSEDKNISLEEFNEIVFNIIKKDLTDAKFNDIDGIIDQITHETNVQKAIFSMSI